MIEIREAMIGDAPSIAEISIGSLGYPCDKSLVERRIKEMDPSKQKVFVAGENGNVDGFVQAELYLSTRM